jgi:hypothetical protein
VGTVTALPPFVHHGFDHAVTSKARLLMVLLLAISAVALASRSARADKRSSVVVVSVQVVESCGVETHSSVAPNAVDLRVRCSSTARPALALVDSAHTMPAVTTVSVPHSQIAVSENGPTLNIEF